MTKLLAFLCATIVAATPADAAPADAVPRGDRSRIWTKRQWEIRYVLLVSEKGYMDASITGARKRNSAGESSGEEKVYSEVEEFFEPTKFLYGPTYDQVATVLIGFDSSGRVLSSNEKLLPFTAKHNVLDHLVLVRGFADERPYRLAEWNQGIAGDLSFSPAVCTARDVRRYEDDWDRDNGMGNFGCREWTAQLYDRSRPYIDVTTYSYGRARNYIGEFVGWSRFTDPAKPVIGKQGKIWLCLHECPAGEQPGPIGNIKTWTKKHGFPMPERPPRQPLYPNSNYLDDIRESAD